jgi:hypothetical protein
MVTLSTCWWVLLTRSINVQQQEGVRERRLTRLAGTGCLINLNEQPNNDGTSVALLKTGLLGGKPAICMLSSMDGFEMPAVCR